ncbi:ZnMc domain-containing protein [Meloidogyne graminicola]|uniref:ZnMc domain-containing protein n=1 Tax=Meloidogyne graminicola TaxID=189291 RepID=A0A8S9ZPX0_9BILA|nr:ZnMc domain-containing protein [Meloidogyne graminicola]
MTHHHIPLIEKSFKEDLNKTFNNKNQINIFNFNKNISAPNKPFLTQKINEINNKGEEEENNEEKKDIKNNLNKFQKLIKNNYYYQNNKMKRNNLSKNNIWNKKKIFGIGIISLILLTCTFTIFDSLLGNNNNENEENDEEISKEDVKNYLNQFGYFEKQEGIAYDQKQGEHRTADQLLEDFTLESLKSAITKFQEFAGLPSTGELDNKTIKKMKKPRCGMQDVEMIRGKGSSRTTTLMWRKRKLIYRLEHTTNDLPTYMQKKALQMAFNAWSQYIPLDFEESKSNYGNVDIRIRFARKGHGDPWSFDGRGGVLAHATFPTDGQLHFDDDENWAFMDVNKIKSYRYTDLFWVSLHEIGHILGLSHSKVETAIMAPFYKDPSELVDWRNNYLKPELTFDDINAAKNIYGNYYLKKEKIIFFRK